MMKKHLLLSLYCLFALYSCELKTQQKSDNPPPNKETTVINQAPKTDKELIFEGGKIIKDEAKEIFATKRKKDSIYNIGKGNLYVYQIGLPKNNIEVLSDSYSSLKMQPNLCVFKMSKDKYYLIKMDNYSENEMTTKYDSTVASIRKYGINEKVEIKNIMELCSKRKIIVQGKKLKTKYNGEIPCYICEK